jgi:hypothetical protein
MNVNPVLDENITIDNTKVEAEVLDTNKFLLLYFLSFGLYGIWWMYKSWRFFKEKESSDILPAARAIFSIFFLYSLLDKIKDFARANGFTKDYSSIGLFIAFVVLNLLSRLPDPYWFVSFAACFCFVQPLNALNFAIENSNIYRAKKETGFNNRQTVLMVLGILFWILVVIGTFVPVDEF